MKTPPISTSFLHRARWLGSHTFHFPLLKEARVQGLPSVQTQSEIQQETSFSKGTIIHKVRFKKKPKRQQFKSKQANPAFL